MKCNFLKQGGILTAAFLLTSCSKEISTPQNTQPTVAAKPLTTIASTNTNKVNPGMYGSVNGTLSPAPQKAVLVAFNDIFISDEVVANVDGSFSLTNLMPGNYNLLISYVPVNADEYSYTTLQRIAVTVSNATNLGIIYLN